MDSMELENGVAGRTIRFIWQDGPTAGKVHEHIFHDDGTVEWHEAGAAQASKGDKADAERPRFLDEAVASGVRLVSYLSKSGFTLTVALNAQDGSIAGVASSDKMWVPVHGRFEVVTR